jgi:hypothetical protein
MQRARHSLRVGYFLPSPYTDVRAAIKTGSLRSVERSEEICFAQSAHFGYPCLHANSSFLSRWPDRIRLVPRRSSDSQFFAPFFAAVADCLGSPVENVDSLTCVIAIRHHGRPILVPTRRHPLSQPRSAIAPERRLRLGHGRGAKSLGRSSHAQAFPAMAETSSFDNEEHQARRFAFARIYFPGQSTTTARPISSTQN